MRKVTAGGRSISQQAWAACKEQELGCSSGSLSSRNLAFLPAESPGHRAATCDCRQKMERQVSPDGFSHP